MTAAVPLEKSGPTSSAPKLDSQNPWPGLAAYDENSREFFHGRGGEAAELLRLARLAPLTALYGKSGLGKSSLLQAGLFPLLRSAHFFPVLIQLDFSDGAQLPVEQARLRLMAECEAHNVECSPFAPDESLWEYLHRKDLTLWSEDNFPLTVVLVFDQFEELFSRSGGKTEVIQHVFDNLADLIENRIPPALAEDAAAARRTRLDLFSQRYRLVLSFREDFLPQIKSWEPKVPSLLQHYLRLEPLSRTNAIDALERAGRDVLDPGVAPVIVDFVGREPDTAPTMFEVTIEPVLLCLCCERLNRRRASGELIGETLVESEGQGILDSFYREALADDDVRGLPDVASFIEEHLIQGEHFRGDYPKEEALNGGLITRRQLNALTSKHRLLRIAPHPDTVRIELIHDRLVPVVSAARAVRKASQHASELELAAKQQRQRAEERERAATQLARALTQMRIFVALAVIGIVATVVSMVLTARERNRANLLASKAERQSEMASFQALTASALNQSRSEPVLGTLLALRAMDASNKISEAARRQAADTLSRVTNALRLRSERQICPGLTSVAFAGDQSTLLAACNDGNPRTVLLPSLDLGRAPGKIPGRGRAAFARKGTRVAFLEPDLQTIRVADTETGDVIATREAPGPVNDFALNGDGDVLVAGGVPTAWIWRLGPARAGGRAHAASAPIVLSGHRDANHTTQFSISSLALARGGKLLATGGADSSIQLWDVTTGANRGTMIGHTDAIGSLEFGPDDRELVSASEDDTARVWDVASRRTRLILDGHANSVFTASFSSDGRKIVTGGADSTVRVWDSESGRELLRLPGHSPVCGTRFVDSDRQVVSASWDGVIRTWNTTGHAGRVTGEVFDDRGKMVATSSMDGSVRLWDVDTGEEERVLLPQGHGPPVPLMGVALADDGRHVASGDMKGHVHVWDVDTGQEIAHLPSANGRINDLAFNPNGKQLLASTQTGEIALWELEPTPSKRVLPPPNGSYNSYPVNHVAYSPNGDWFAASSDDGTLWLWPARRQEDPLPIKAHAGRIFQLLFSPDSTSVVTTGTDKFARVFDVRSGRLLLEAAHSDLVMDGVFGARGRQLVTATLAGEIVVWDMETKSKLPRTPPPHAACVGLGISRDGKLAASFSWDRTAKVWDTTTWHEVASFGHQDIVDRGVISPDGSHIATYTRRDGVRIMPVDRDAIRRLAESRVTRRLTRAECEQYAGGRCSDLANESRGSPSE